MNRTARNEAGTLMHLALSVHQAWAMLIKIMHTVTTKLQTTLPIAKLRCGQCRGVFSAEGQLADSLIYRLLFFSGLHFGDRIKTDCPTCGGTEAVFLSAGYSLAKA